MIAHYKRTEKDANIFGDITNQVSRSLEEWYGVGASLDSTNPEVRSYRNSFMLRYPVTTPQVQKKNILVKIRRKPKMSSLIEAIHADIHQNVLREYQSLKFVFEQLGHLQDSLGAIRPLAYIARYFAIVMEEFPSRTLRQLLTDQRSSKTSQSLCDLKDAAKKTGQWLHYFHHHIHTSSEMPYTVDDMLQEVKTYAERIEFLSHGRVQARMLQKAFSEEFANIHIERMAFSQSHADMSCDNVLYSPDHRVCIIDIKTDFAPVYADLGLVLIHPDTSKLQIFSGGRYYPESLLSQYRAKIIEGYFEQEPDHQVLARVYSAIKILDKWLMYEELMHRYKGLKHILSIPAGPFVSTYFHHLLKKYLALIAEREDPQALDASEIADGSVKTSL